MKIHIETEPFKKAIDLASLALSAKTRLPQLTCAFLEGEGETIRVTCDSLDARISVELEGARFAKPFKTLVSPRMLKAAMRDAESVLTITDDSIAVDSGGKSKILTHPHVDFPQAWEEPTTNEVDAPKFLSAIKVVSTCAGDPYDWISYSHERKELFGTNGKALSVYPADLGSEHPFLLPAAQSKILTSCLQADDLSFGIAPGHIFAQQGALKVWIKIIEGKLLPYHMLLVQSPFSASVGREELQRSLDALLDFSEGDYQHAKFTPKDGAWELSSRNNSGDTTVRCAVEKMGEDAEEMESFTTGRGWVANIIRNWSADRIRIRRTQNHIQFEPDDQSGCMGVVAMIRQ